MARIHLIEGPVGAGKSTFATKLSHEIGAPHVDLDEWIVTLFRADRPEADFMAWYAERKRRCIEQIWRVACEILESGSDVVLELGLIQRADRAQFYDRVDGSDCELTVHLMDAPEAVRRERVRARNAAQDGTFKMAVPDAVFELANGLWEAPDDRELAERRIVVWDLGVERL